MGEGSDAIDPSDEALLREAARAPFRDLVPHLVPGATVGRYTVGELLGRGGMGAVYAAVDRVLERRVALKVLRADAIGPDERRARFEREARAAAAATGPHIAAVYDVGHDGDVVYFAMELVEGMTLRARMAAGLAISDAVRIAGGIARGLERAHAVGVVHRDLKPDNVMLDGNDEPKVLDFGLAKRLDVLTENADDGPTEIQTREGRLLGTPAYMSPEQAKGHDLDARSDVFSFGVMLYELLAGRRPFVGKTTIEILIAIDRDEPAPPSTIRAEVPPELDALVAKCLAKSAAARPTIAEIAAVLAGEATLPSPRRKRLRWAVAGCGLVVALAVVAWPLSRGCGRPEVELTDVSAARAAYEEGVSNLAAGAEAFTSFERAVELDPEFAAAHAQLARLGLVRNRARGLVPASVYREHLRRALAHESRLPPRLRAMAYALEPFGLRDPPDVAETRARFERLAREYPDDLPIATTASFFVRVSDPTTNLAETERMLRTFPDVPNPSADRGLVLAYAGRFDEAKTILDRCLERWPRARGCLQTRALVAMVEGDCERMERVARQFVVAAPDFEDGYVFLASSLAGRRPVQAVQEALSQRLAHLAAEERPAAEASDASDVAVLAGDLDTALARARDAMRLVATSPWKETHATSARRVALLLRELGREDEAVRIASEYVDRRDGWSGGSQLTPQLVAIAHGRVDESTRNELDEDEWLVHRAYPAWLTGRAEDATAALAAGVQPAPFAFGLFAELAIGGIELRAGHAAEAVPRLERATRSCRALTDPVEHTQAFDRLGEARESVADVAGACAAYQVVLARWGASTGSTTAAHARTRVVALGCKI